MKTFSSRIRVLETTRVPRPVILSIFSLQTLLMASKKSLRDHCSSGLSLAFEAPPPTFALVGSLSLSFFFLGDFERRSGDPERSRVPLLLLLRWTLPPAPLFLLGPGLAARDILLSRSARLPHDQGKVYVGNPNPVMKAPLLSLIHSDIILRICPQDTNQDTTYTQQCGNRSTKKQFRDKTSYKSSFFYYKIDGRSEHSGEIICTKWRLNKTCYHIQGTCCRDMALNPTLGPSMCHRRVGFLEFPGW